MTFLVWVYTSQDFAQTQQNFARSHDRETVTFRNSGCRVIGLTIAVVFSRISKYSVHKLHVLLEMFSNFQI